MKNASLLANVIKNKTIQMDFDDRVNPVAADILYHSYGKPGRKGLQPNKIQNTQMIIDGSGNAQLKFKTGAPDATHIDISDPGDVRGYAQKTALNNFTMGKLYTGQIFG